jgi:hypothetical protein
MLDLLTDTLTPALQADESKLSVAEELRLQLKAKALARIAPDSDVPADATDVMKEQSPRYARGGVFVVQRWSGYVTERMADSFRGVINDLNEPLNPPEEVVLELSDVPLQDQRLVQVGGLFYWHLGKQENELGTLRLYMEIRFRRVPRSSAITAPRFSTIFGNADQSAGQ